MADYEDLTDEEIQQLIALGIIPDERADLEDQIKQAQSLRYGRGPQMYGNGNVQTAASPLEFLGYTLQGMKADKDLSRLRAQQEAMLKQQAMGRKLYFDALRRKQNPIPGDPYDMSGAVE